MNFCEENDIALNIPLIKDQMLKASNKNITNEKLKL